MELVVKAAPRISASQFKRVLERAGSPAAPAADELYQTVVRHELDPAVALAFFAHESQYGTDGVAKDFNTRNWGNVRTHFDPAIRSGRTVSTPFGQFTTYHTWNDGLDDWCRRILGRYMRERGLHTVEQIVPVYAPAGDFGNSPAVYIRKVRQLVERWQREDTGAITDEQLISRYRVTVDDTKVRQGPGRNFPAAASMNAGDTFVSDGITRGETIGGDDRWMHRADGLGFTHASLLARLP